MAKHDLIVGWLTDHLAEQARKHGRKFVFCFFDARSGLPVHRIV